MKNRHLHSHSKFQAIFIAALTVFFMAGTTAMKPVLPTAGQMKPAGTGYTDGLLQFTSGGHVIGFTSQGIYATNGSHALHVDFVNANQVQPLSDESTSGQGKAAPLSRVMYGDLWSGITLTYTASPGNIYTTTYALLPGADVKNIRLHYNAPLTLNNDGTLGLAFDTGRMTESAPVAWQEIHGSRIPVDVSYRLNKQELSFTLGAYNPRYALTIDPTLVWNTFLGGSGLDYSTRITTDSSGNIYVTGHSDAAWGSPVRGHTNDTYDDAFVAKLDSSGNLLWNTFLGTNGIDWGNGIAVDSDGNVYIAGHSAAAWTCLPAPCTVQAHTPGYDAFAAKLDSSGNLLWNTFLGGSGVDLAYGIDLDGSGNIYVTGSSTVKWGNPVNDFSIGVSNAFVAKLNSSGTLLWNSFLGGSGGDNYASDIAVDGSGNSYVTGRGGPSWGNPVRDYTDNTDAIVARLDSSGHLVWNTFLGSGLGWDYGNSIAVDDSGNIYVTGESSSTWGSPVRAHSVTEYSDIFVAKLDSSSGELTWNTFMGGDGADAGLDIALDAGGNIYITGYSGTNWGCFPSSCTVHEFSDLMDALAAKLDSSGNLVWNTFQGGSGVDEGLAIAVSSSGKVYLTGLSNDEWGCEDISCTKQPYTNGGDDVFVAEVTAYTISGDAGIPGATLSYTDGTTKTAVTQADGSYRFPVSYNWSGTIAPSLACYTFAPHTYTGITTDQAAQDFTPVIDPTCANINVTIGGSNQGSTLLPPAGNQRVNYIGINTGPVTVTSTNSTKIIAAERDSWWDGKEWTSYSQLMGLPAGQVSDTYVFPAYNNVTLDEQMRIGNVDPTQTSVVTVTIGGHLQATYTLLPSQAVRDNYVGVNDGPVIVQGTAGVKIIAAERDSWWDGMEWTSFAQTMGLPAGQISDKYLFPAYNNDTLDEQMRIGNVDPTKTSVVTVTIGGHLQATYTLLPNQSVRDNYAGVNDGPVVVQGTAGVKIIAAERDSWWTGTRWTSFVQTLGLPAGLLSDTYVFPAYNNVTLDEQLRFGVP